MKRLWKYLNNTFIISTNTSRKKMLIFGLDHTAKLQSHSADADILILYNRTLPVMSLYVTLFSEWRNKKAIYRGSTMAFQNMLTELVDVKLHEWMAKVGTKFIDTSVEYKSVFPNYKKPFYEGSYDEIVNEVSALAANMQPYSQLNSVRSEVEDFYTELFDLRNVQQNDESDFVAAATSLEAQRIILGNMIYANLGALMQKYADSPEDIEQYFDLPLIRSKTIKDDEPEVNHLVMAATLTLGQVFELGLAGLPGKSVLIEWGDSSTLPLTFTDLSTIFENHTYTAAGSYIVKVLGNVESLSELHCNNSGLTSINIESAPNLKEVILQGNNLDQQSANNLAIVLAANGKSGGVFNIIGGGNAVPDRSIPEVDEAMNALQSRSWVILTN